MKRKLKHIRAVEFSHDTANVALLLYDVYAWAVDHEDATILSLTFRNSYESGHYVESFDVVYEK